MLHQIKIERFISSKIFNSLAFAILIFFISSTSYAQTTNINIATGTQQCPTCSPPTQQTIYAPTIGLPEATDSEIVLNCRSSQTMTVTPTFYTSDGEAIIGAPLNLQPSEMRFVSIESLIPPEHRGQHLWGGMSLSYTGRTLEMWAQITLRGLNGIGSADVTFSNLTGRGMNTQEAVWYMPNGNSTAILALGNSSNSTIQTRLQYSNGEIQDVSIAPFATRYIRRQNGNSVKLTTTGAAGSLKAMGFVTNNSQNFTSGIRFYETQGVVQPNLFATNFKVRNHASHLLLKNTSSSSITAQARFLPTTGTGNAVDLSSITINAGEVAELNLQPLVTAAANRTDLDSVSVQITNSGTAGSLIGALYSTNRTTNLTQDIPLRDSGRLRNSTGAYPFRLDDDYTSVVYINNVGSQTAEFNVKLYYAGGSYTFATQQLAAGATASFDIKRLRDNRVLDRSGNAIPANITVGQFAWSMIHITEETKLVGRSEVISRSRKINSSYSCPVCCPNSGPSFNPEPVLLFADSFYSYYLDGFWFDCYGREAGRTAEYLSPVVANPEIASAAMPEAGLFRADGFSPGETSWSADYYFWQYQDDGMDCYNISQYTNTGGPIEVTPRVTISSIKAVGKDNTATVRVEVSNNPNNQTITLALSPRSGTTGEAQFTSNNSTTRTITGTTDVEIKGINESSTKDNMLLEAMFNNRRLDDEDFTVIFVTLSLRFSSNDTVSSDNSARTAQQSGVGTVQLGGPFLSLGSEPVLWRHAVEIVGTILPSNFSEPIVLQREVVATNTWSENNVLVGNAGCNPPQQTPCPDTSSPQYRDDNPQSGNSGGKVYDIDSPGSNLVSTAPIGTIRRRRTNFRQWATISQLQGGQTMDVRVSSDIQWFQRISIEKTRRGVQINNDVGTNDNQVGLGTTLLSWNLQ